VTKAPGTGLGTGDACGGHHLLHPLPGVGPPPGDQKRLIGWKTSDDLRREGHLPELSLISLFQRAERSHPFGNTDVIWGQCQHFGEASTAPQKKLTQTGRSGVLGRNGCKKPLPLGDSEVLALARGRKQRGG